ncbi:acetate/propionate family kinase [Loigolactobacillus jiayinensis]|uniref:Acetate kinase n=1 Tax=Loigolactobacillus jiayinensis TaxID=2486016 RepID=A0ABW1RKB3_9LACO|nr:acetate kinase [Loigolactobacillus jiayinensis]
MQKILTINAGSSSLKWNLFALPMETSLAHGLVERLNEPVATFKLVTSGQKYSQPVNTLTATTAVDLVLDKLEELAIIHARTEISVVGHRIVAGGTAFKHPTLVTPAVLAQIIDLSDYAPLHNPAEAHYIKLFMAALPHAQQMAVFDSQFFTQLPEINAIYSIPYDYTKQYNIRRYGEHGISHDYLAKRSADLLRKPLTQLKLITLHLGSGASITAIKNGRPYDTSMGFTPLTGVTMSTRAGDVDPALVPFLAKKLNLPADEVVTDILNRQSGLLGISGLSMDMRDLMAAEQENPRAKLAIDIFINRIVKYIGSYYVELGGLDALVFSGGIGENDTDIRARIAHGVQALGINLDAKRNQANNEGPISPENAAITALLVPTNEELAIVRQVVQALNVTQR